jgi:hypothetical protein
MKRRRQFNVKGGVIYPFSSARWGKGAVGYGRRTPVPSILYIVRYVTIFYRKEQAVVHVNGCREFV